jgi:hypothetical protein
MSVDYDAWLDRKLYEYDLERERDYEHQQQLEQQEFELGEMETDEE